jgi:hypothetical protein
MIAHVWRIVAGAAGSLKRGNAADNQAAGQHIIVDARHFRDVDGLRVEKWPARAPPLPADLP